MLKVRYMAQKYIYLSGAKSNDPLHIVYVPNIFKFTKISAKGTQKLLKWYEWAQTVRDICKFGDLAYLGKKTTLSKIADPGPTSMGSFCK